MINKIYELHFERIVKTWTPMSNYILLNVTDVSNSTKILLSEIALIIMNGYVISNIGTVYINLEYNYNKYNDVYIYYRTELLKYLRNKEIDSILNK